MTSESVVLRFHVSFVLEGKVEAARSTSDKLDTTMVVDSKQSKSR